MFRKLICRCTILTAVTIMLVSVAFASDIPADVERILREIRQDQPAPALSYLKSAKSVNHGCAYYRGTYNGIAITVETHPDSNRVASVLLKIPGADVTKNILPAVKRVIGPPRYSSPKESQYSWEWPKYRSASVHYVRGGKPGYGFTIVSLFYR
ncbi:MAG: hypothetical protein CVU43_21675 [Chloroflexi bacterium HGW-Chloroflexi-5]|jgi:hypothetical protein|nr:MAG: hypothetical protein CVU43_21675 [Chloroflexi bacterium HGW-Chloroflexi-5]